MQTVDDSWPEYWIDVETETARIASTREAYEALDHDHVVGWFARHWELLEPLVDDPALEHVRLATFDGDQLGYRFRVIAVAAGGTIRLVEFAVLD